jgi:hypothetical protein
MRNINSFADQILDWERLLQAVDDNTADMEVAQPQRAALAQTLAEARNLKAVQDSHAARRQQSTQEILELAKMGREQARRLRGMAKGLLGTQNERLVQFQVAPIRRRRGKNTRPPEPPPPVEVSADSSETPTE